MGSQPLIGGYDVRAGRRRWAWLDAARGLPLSHFGTFSPRPADRSMSGDRFDFTAPRTEGTLKMNVKTTAQDVQSDVSKAISGAEDMLTQAASATADKAAELRTRALEQLQALRERMREAQDVALEKSKAAAQVTDEYVHENPWRSIIAAVSVGVVIGLLIGGRR